MQCHSHNCARRISGIPNIISVLRLKWFDFGPKHKSPSIAGYTIRQVYYVTEWIYWSLPKKPFQGSLLCFYGSLVCKPFMSRQSSSESALCCLFDTFMTSHQSLLKPCKSWAGPLVSFPRSYYLNVQSCTCTRICHCVWAWPSMFTSSAACLPRVR